MQGRTSALRLVSGLPMSTAERADPRLDQ